jgi:hypothetical protein
MRAVAANARHKEERPTRRRHTVNDATNDIATEMNASERRPLASAAAM